MQDVEGKTAFITGAASGIGYGMAGAFADAGMKVVMADVEADALADSAAKLSRESNRIVAIQLDVTDRDAMAAAADEAEATFGAIHLVCNNAGVSSRGPLDEATYEDWDWVMGVNLGGVINGVRTFVPRIKSHGEGGHVVNTSSIAGLLSTAGNGVYATTKHAVVGLSDALRQELAPHNIGVSVLCPGTVDTKINHSSRNRQSAYGKGGADLTPEQVALLDQSMAHGWSPREIGDYVLAAIREDRHYILPHNEFRDVYRKKVDAIIDDFSDEPPTEKQIESMRFRAEAFSGFWGDDGPSTDEI